jgi:hypothetical protein
MHLGSRKIRSAGRSSGSIEITLPVELEVLEGVECRLFVRDGPRPEIVLQPDVSAAVTLFRDLWQKVRLGLGEIAEIGEFSAGDFSMAFFPPPHWQERPPLAYTDALAVLQGQVDARADPRHRGAVVRLLACMAVAAAYRLGLTGPLGLGFGESVAYLVTGSAAGLGADFERGMAHLTFWGDSAPQRVGSPFSDEVWQQARRGFKRVYDRFCAWQERPEAYAEARERWHKALAVEVGVGISSVGDFVEQRRRSGRR